MYDTIMIDFIMIDIIIWCIDKYIYMHIKTGTNI